MSDYSGMSDSTEISDSATEPDDIPDIPIRQGYQCRFPVEVMENILAFLASEVLDDVDQTITNGAIIDDLEIDDTVSEDWTSSSSDDSVRWKNSSIGAMRAVQQSSSALYKVATPFLYRYLRVTGPEITSMLRSFHGVKEVREVILQDRREDIHPLDYHLYHRLQWALSFVHQIHLTVCPVPSYEDDRLHDYTELCTVLRRLGRPQLWPALDKVSFRVRERHGGKPADPKSYLAYEGTLIRAIGPTLHPTSLDIEFPDPPLNTHFDVVETYTPSLLCSMRADHVTLSNITDSTQGIPSARLSLTLGFSSICGSLDRGHPSNPSVLFDRKCFILTTCLEYVPSLTLIGIERGLQGLPLDHIRAELADALDMSECGHGSGPENDESRYRIKPWNSLEGGDWDIWYSYDEPFGEHFCRSDIEGPDDSGGDDRVYEAESLDGRNEVHAIYDVIQDEVKGGIQAIYKKAISTDRRIESMAKRMSTIGKTIGSHTDSMVEMKGNLVTMKEDMATMMSMMKEMASKGNKGNGRIRRYQGKRISKKAEKRAEEQVTGWSDA